MAGKAYKKKLEAVYVDSIEKGDVILLKELSDIYGQYGVEDIVATTGGTVVLEVRAARGNVVAPAKYFFPGGNLVIRKVVHNG